MHIPAEVRLILWARGLRAFCDGFNAVLLPAYLLALGFASWQVGVLSTATLLGSALMTLALGRWGGKFTERALLPAAGLLMMMTGLAFAGVHAYGLLLLAALFGTLNPSSGDVSVFLPLEHARLSNLANGAERTAAFSRYSFVGALCAALGALAAGLPELLTRLGMDRLSGLRVMFVAYGCCGAAIFLLYRCLPTPNPVGARRTDSALAASRKFVQRLAALFALDSLAGGLLVNALLALWLFTRFKLSLAAAGQFFFCAGLLSALSQLAAPWLAQRIGLVNTMVFTHIPASLCLIAAAYVNSLPLVLALLLLRSLLAQMDVPARSAFVMAAVQPTERLAAASYTAVPRSLAAAVSPALGGALFAAGWLAAPLLLCGGLKIGYDLILWRMYHNHVASRI